jgi:hypothetical protein
VLPALSCVLAGVQGSPFAFGGSGQGVEQLVRIHGDRAGVPAFGRVVGRRGTTDAVCFVQVAAGLLGTEFGILARAHGRGWHFWSLSLGRAKGRCRWPLPVGRAGLARGRAAGSWSGSGGRGRWVP